MIDPMEMSDEEIFLDRARQFGARVYRVAGYPDFAKRVESGLEDQCNSVRLGKFFLEESPFHGEDFNKAWNNAVCQVEADNLPGNRRTL